MLLLFIIKPETCAMFHNSFTITETSMLAPRPAGLRSKKQFISHFAFKTLAR